MSVIEKLTKPAHSIDMNDIIREGNPTLRAVAEDVTFPLTDQEIILGEKMLQFLRNSQDPVTAEKMGLDKIFMDAGFEWRDPGCSMCLGMNPDKVPDGVHCASTSNRNFEDRQGFGAKTHLCSPAMAAAAAIAGRFVDVRQLPEVQ